MTEATRTGSRFGEAEDEKGWETAMPGMRVLVFFRGDNVRHDRVLVRKVGAPESRQRPEHAASGGRGEYMEVSSFRDDISRVQRSEPMYAFGWSDSLSRFRERLAIATVANPVFLLPWRAAGAGRLDSGVRRLRGSRPGVTQRFVVDDAEPEFGPTVADRRGEFPGFLGSGLRDRGVEVGCSCA